MIFSIVKQSLDIRLGFENPPKINADTECAAAIGMLAKLYGLPLPERREDFPLMLKELEEQTKGLAAADQAEKLAQILFSYEPKAGVDDEKYELLKYSYEETGKEPHR